MVEISIDECLPQIARGLAIVRHLSSGRICFAHRDARKIADVEPSEVGRRFRGTWIAGTDVQWGRERVIADIRRVVASSACALKRRNAARHQAAGQCVIVDARHARSVNGPSSGKSSPPGCSSAGTSGWTLELMLTKKG